MQHDAPPIDEMQADETPAGDAEAEATAAVTPVSKPQREALAAYTRALQLTNSARLRHWAELRLTTTQLYLLSLLLDRDARSVGELAEEMQVSPATMTGLTDRLVRQQYIARQTDPDDRRIVRIVLTQQGRQVFDGPVARAPLGLRGPLEQLGAAKTSQLADLLNELAALPRTGRT